METRCSRLFCDLNLPGMIDMDRAIMWIMAICALIGGMDRMLGNRLGLGKKFEEGFHLMGPTALSMAGIICLVPVFSRLLSGRIATLLLHAGIDPAMFGSLIAIDMGGYQLAHELAQDVRVANFAGVVVAAILGCSISFTIPIGMGMLKDETRRDFARGTLCGFIAIPVSLLLGGLLCGLNPGEILVQGLPVLALSILVLLGLWKKQDLVIRCFSVFASGISILTTLGLMLGAFAYMTGIQLLPGLAPIEDAMAVVSGIAIVMLGSLPFAAILQHLLKLPLEWFGRKTGMNSASAAGLLIGMVSVMPAIALVKDMDRRGRIVNAAFFVCAASALAAQLGFTAGVNAAMLPALLISKLAGGCTGIIIALLATKKAV